MVICVFSSQSYAESISMATEDKLKAIYLVHISKLTTWIDNKKVTNAFSICIDESSKISKRLTEIIGRKIQGKPLQLQHELTLQNLINCNVYYVNASDYPIFKQFKSQLEKYAVLTVSSKEDFTDDEGGIIEYYIDQNNKKVRMRVNLQTMHRSQLNISSKLLRLMDIRN